jgi:ABC-type branched-subunit amino acid transport system ATPase component
MSLLELSGVRKTFGGIDAVNRVTFSVESGTVVGLIGPNGSGKTTLFNIITGLYPDYEGIITFEERELDRSSRPDQIKAFGIARTFQNIRLFSSMTVLENVVVGMHCLTHTTLLQAIVRTQGNRKREKWVREEAYRALEFFGSRLTDKVDKPAASLSYANRRRLEIARAMVANPKLLLLDEPTAGMNPKESEELADKIKQMQRQGISLIVIEHDMNVVMGISDRIVVLDHGAKIAEGIPEEIQGNKRVLDAYLGESD